MSASAARKLLSERKAPAYQKLGVSIDKFLASGDFAPARKVPYKSLEGGYERAGLAQLGSTLGESTSNWETDERLLARFCVLLSSEAPTLHEYCHLPLHGAMRVLLASGDDPASEAATILAEEIREHHGDFSSFARFFLHLGRDLTWLLTPHQDHRAPFQSPLANLIWQLSDNDLIACKESLVKCPGFFPALARHRPEVTRACLFPSFRSGQRDELWQAVVEGTDVFDQDYLAFVSNLEDYAAPKAFRLLQHLNSLRAGRYQEEVLRAARNPYAALDRDCLTFLMTETREEILPLAQAALGIPEAHRQLHTGGVFLKLYKLAIKKWKKGGQEFFAIALPHLPLHNLDEIADLFIDRPPDGCGPTLVAGMRSCLQNSQSGSTEFYLQRYAERGCQTLLPLFHELLTGSSKKLRSLAVQAIVQTGDQSAHDKALEYLSAKKAEARLGGIALLQALGGPEAQRALKDALKDEPREKVRDQIKASLKEFPKGEDLADTERPKPLGLRDLPGLLAEEEPRLNEPKAPWLAIEKLPPLLLRNRKPLSLLGLRFLIAKQAKIKAVSLSPEIAPVLSLLQRQKTGDFASALFEQWQSSKQAASDHWVLTLCGALGDHRMLVALKEPISEWVKKSRHKLAEHAARAIALLPGPEALITLASLGERYRTKHRNVGRACHEALAEAAQKQGVSLDELGDHIVPDFGFTGERERTFTWPKGTLVASLNPQLQLSWHNPATGKDTKSLPSRAPAAIRQEVSDLPKRLRESWKAQGIRHERALIFQRRWPFARWCELYQENPLLQSLAEQLVWGIFTRSDEAIIETFRRYPNGLLADAEGESVSPRKTQLIRLIHPLDLPGDSLQQWRDHFNRHKLKQSFPQLDRPVRRMDGRKKNRKELVSLEGRLSYCGTFKGRADRNGWARSPVFDGGSIFTYYKSFSEAGIDALLELRDHNVSDAPTDPLTFGKAYFAKVEPTQRLPSSYEEPSIQSPNVVTFAEVPPIILSEILCDLESFSA